jgi:hypothetical protein
MINRHHLAVVDAGTGRLLLDPRSSGLPIVATDAPIRIGSWLTAWLGNHHLDGAPRWMWFGRCDPAHTICDWLVVAEIRPPAAFVAANAWIDLARPAPLEEAYQRDAIEVLRLATRYPGAFGPYADPSIWQALDDFTRSFRTISNQADVAARPRVHKVTPTRLAASCRRGPDSGECIYIKGSTERTSVEREVLGILSTLSPDASPRVLAEHDGWRLQILADAGPPLGATADPVILDRVIATYAGVQTRWFLADPTLRTIPSLTCETLWRRVLAFLSLHRGPHADAVDTILAAASDAYEELCQADYPLSIVHIDPTANNIRLDGETVRFIDFENAVVAPAPLGCELMLARLERAAAAWPSQLSADLRRTYAAQWQELVPGMRVPIWSEHLRLLAKVMVATIHWSVLCERVETGEWAGSLERVWSTGIERLAALAPRAASR